MTKRPDAAERYRETMEREPPPPVDPAEPLAWQWDYRGTKEEREKLRADLLNDIPEDRGPQPEQEEALF